MALRCWFPCLLAVSNVKGIFSVSPDESHCAARDDRGTCRQPEDPEELVALQAKIDKFPHWGWWGRFHRGRGYYKVATTTEAPVQPFWISAAVDTPCNKACGEFNDGLDVFRCGKEEMAAINSTEAIEALVAELGLPNTTCSQAPSGNPYRNGGGSPFIRESPKPNDCYFWDPNKPASDIDCDTIGFPGRSPLCYCVPAAPAVPDPTGPWFSADRDQTCNDLCTSKNYTECGKEEMAAINSSLALADLLSILNLTCTPPNSGNAFRDGGGSPFTRGPPEANDCYYWDPSQPASNIDCGTIGFSGRRPLCYCK